MCGEVAFAVFPFEGRIRAGSAVPSGREFDSAATSITFFYGLMTVAAVKGTTILRHKYAFHPWFYSCTVHRNHLLTSC